MFYRSVIFSLAAGFLLAILAVNVFLPDHNKQKLTQQGRYNLIVISLDTLRADRLGVYGYHRNTSPQIDSFFRSSVSFEHAVSPSSWTLPAHMSLFTGLYPSRHGVVRTRIKQVWSRLPGDLRTMAEILQSAGYRTYAYTGGGNIGSKYGFSRGFEAYHEREEVALGERRGLRKSLAQVRSLLAKQSEEEQFFVFIHTYDIHCPYEPPPEYQNLFKSKSAKPIVTNRCGDAFYGTRNISAAEALYISDHYDASIRWVDDILGRFFSFLQQGRYLDNTVIVITSDHGEAFLEHGRIGHQFSLHKELLMVPLAIYVPKISPLRVAIPVSLVDILPTLLDILGLEVPASIDGNSLLATMMGDVDLGLQRRFQFSELDRGIVLRSFLDPLERHFILDRTNGNALLYNLASDPTEQNNLAALQQSTVTELSEEMNSFIGELEQRDAELGHEPRADEMEKLKSLGYF